MLLRSAERKPDVNAACFESNPPSVRRRSVSLGDRPAAGGERGPWGPRAGGLHTSPAAPRPGRPPTAGPRSTLVARCRGGAGETDGRVLPGGAPWVRRPLGPGRRAGRGGVGSVAPPRRAVRSTSGSPPRPTPDGLLPAPPPAGRKFFGRRAS